MNSMIRGALGACLLGLLGCAAELDRADPTSAAEAAAYQVVTGSLLPLKTGNTWTYRVTEAGEQATKKVTIGALEPVGGSGPSRATRAYRSTTDKAGGGKTISWQAEVDGRVVRYREQSIKKSGAEGEEVSWAPPNLRVDGNPARTTLGAQWTETYVESVTNAGVSFERTETETWTVEGVDVVVTVPAGTFRTLQLKKETAAGAKTFWYARGVGKIKETGGQTEELESYTLAR